MKPLSIGRHGRTGVVAAVIIILLSATGDSAGPAPIPSDRLQAIFEAGRAAFFAEIGARLPASPHRALLSDEEVRQLTGGLSDLYDRVIALAWQKDAPAYAALMRDGDSAVFDQRFRALSVDYARRLVDNLFRRSSEYDFLITLPPFKEKRPFELVLRTLGYGARSGDPQVPPGQLNRPPDPNLARQWWLQAIRLPEAHRLSVGKGIVVAVLDTGIDRSLGLFAGRLTEGVSLVGRSGPPWTSGNDETWDWGDHGTVVGSVLLTTAPGVTIMPIRHADGVVMNDPPYSYWLHETMAAAIYSAVHRGAQVINISAVLGEDSSVLRDAVAYAWEHNVLIVAGAGRWGRLARIGDPFPPDYPASYSNLIQTGTFGIDKGLFKVVEWLHPSPAMDVVTPGADVYMEFPVYSEAKNSAGSGTSLSAPVGAGVAAMMMAVRPMTPAEAKTPGAYCRLIERGLQHTANPWLVGYSEWTPTGGHGVIDAAAAVEWIRKQ